MKPPGVKISPECFPETVFQALVSALQTLLRTGGDRMGQQRTGWDKRGGQHETGEEDRRGQDGTAEEDRRGQHGTGGQDRSGELFVFSVSVQEELMRETTSPLTVSTRPLFT